MKTYYENWRKTPLAQRKMKDWIRDPEGLLTGNGYIEGVYEFLFVNEKDKTAISAYIGQAGNNPTAPDYVADDIYERLLQHLKRWLGGKYFTYWTGLNEDDRNWKIELHLLSEEKDYSERLRKESAYISEKHPFLQDTADGTFELYPTKYGYRRNDLCIHPWTREGEQTGQRRLAFLHRVEKIKKTN